MRDALQYGCDSRVLDVHNAGFVLAKPPDAICRDSTLDLFDMIDSISMLCKATPQDGRKGKSRCKRHILSIHRYCETARHLHTAGKPRLRVPLASRNPTKDDPRLLAARGLLPSKFVAQLLLRDFQQAQRAQVGGHKPHVIPPNLFWLGFSWVGEARQATRHASPTAVHDGCVRAMHWRTFRLPWRRGRIIHNFPIVNLQASGLRLAVNVCMPLKIAVCIPERALADAHLCLGVTL